MKGNRKTKIGIPRALLYHQLFPLWNAFFDELGFDVIASGETTEEIVRKGLNSTGSDLCLPVKTFLGHVHEIKDFVDFLFVPRYISMEEDSYMCPKFLGLPDMVRASIIDLPPLVDSPMNFKKDGIKGFLDGISNILKINRRNVERAYRKALNSFVDNPMSNFSIINQKIPPSPLSPPVKGGDNAPQPTGVTPPASPPPLKIRGGRGSYDSKGEEGGVNKFPSLLAGEGGVRGVKIGILGRPYLLYDSCLNRSLVNKIEDFGADIKIRNIPSQEEIADAMNLLPKPVYWSMGKEVIASAYSYLKERDVDGIINLVSVACGPDSFTSEIINDMRKKMPGIPYMTLYLDEHTSDLGVFTRIEAFIDMIKRRSKAA